jgi:hypothetical protein
MGENGDKILEVVRLFIDNINETSKGVDGVQRTVNKLSDDLKSVVNAAKVALAVFGIAIFIGALIVFLADKGWLAPKEPIPIAQPAPNKEQLKQEILKELLKNLRDKEHCDEISESDGSGQN